MMHLEFVYDEDLGALCALYDEAGEIVSIGCDPAPER